MRSVLEEFAYGNIAPNIQGFKRNSEFGKVMELVSRNEKKLLERLATDDKALLEKYIDAQGEANRLTAVKNFIYGFKLGMTMTAEAFVGMGDLIVSGED